MITVGGNGLRRRHSGTDASRPPSPAHAASRVRLDAMDTISFARGVPAPECLPVEELADCARAAIERDGTTVLSYGPSAGTRRCASGSPSGTASIRPASSSPTARCRALSSSPIGSPGARPGRGTDVRSPAEDLRAPASTCVAVADGRRRARPGRARAGARARQRAGVPLHDPDLPEPERPHAERRTASAARRARARARPTRARGRPVRTGALRGRPAADLVRARRRRARHLLVLLLEDDRARAARRLLRPAAGTRRRAGALAVSTYITPVLLGQATVFEFLRARQLRAERRAVSRSAARPPGRDARGARAGAPGRPGAGRRAATSSGSSCRASCKEVLERPLGPSSPAPTSAAHRTAPPRVQLRVAGGDREGVRRTSAQAAVAATRRGWRGGTAASPGYAA